MDRTRVAVIPGGHRACAGLRLPRGPASSGVDRHPRDVPDREGLCILLSVDEATNLALSAARRLSSSRYPCGSRVKEGKAS